ncbi:MAG: TIGR01212 family radical SAM protein [Oscillospiraceae bacterium]
MKFIFSDDNKRYHTLSYHNKHTYGEKVYKAAIDAGFTCPNIDGSRGVGGCIYCSGGSGYFTSDCSVSVAEQFKRERERITAKHRNARIIAYFQAHTNTYAPAERLCELYHEAIAAGAQGISVATRADCINADIAELLKQLPVPVTVELGLQTIHDTTAAKINRCHSYAEFLRGYKLLKQAGLRICVHIINGLPDETEEMMLVTARELAALRPDGIKIHLLHVIRDTVLEKLYISGEYRPLDKQQYIDIVIKQLELFAPETVIERVTGDGDKSALVAPMWSCDKISVLGGIDKRMAELDTWQGRLFVEPAYIGSDVTQGLYEYYRRCILYGRVGDCLPIAAELAAVHNLCLSEVEKAYSMLTEQGFAHYDNSGRLKVTSHNLL